MKNTTLCYIENEKGEYLMLHRVKKQNDLNHDKWIGVGGKCEEGESPEECVCRETWEETGLTLTEYRYRGVITFVSDIWEGEYMHCSRPPAGRASCGSAMRACWNGCTRTRWRLCPSGRGTSCFWS